MWNVMLDELPKSWNGYAFNTDFRIGIQISMLFADDSISDYEKLETAYELLFDGIAPEYDLFHEFIEWYLNGWYTDGVSKKKEPVKVYDYNVDQWRIYSAFWMQYQIDINKAELHYWVFMGMLVNLEECSFTRVKDIRIKKIEPKMSKEIKAAIADAKKIYALEDTKEPDNKAEVDEALQMFDRLRGKV